MRALGLGGTPGLSPLEVRSDAAPQSSRGQPPRRGNLLERSSALQGQWTRALGCRKGPSAPRKVWVPGHSTPHPGACRNEAHPAEGAVFLRGCSARTPFSEGSLNNHKGKTTPLHTERLCQEVSTGHRESIHLLSPYHICNNGRAANLAQISFDS